MKNAFLIPSGRRRSLFRKNVEIKECDFLKNLFNRSEIEYLLNGKLALEMFNFRSPSFKQLGLKRDNWRYL
jgi:arsenate reductase-like glutaredoxin family protein